MQKYTSKQVRKMWIDFWKSKNHQERPSASLIPINDPSLLWINSGVATLKDFFSGKRIPENPRIVNSQKSIRTSDIDNVGVTARHHTLFEMLGNFSIGEYFKTEALTWAYELLFQVFKFDQNKIYITYFEDDQEAYDMWIKLGIKPNHLIKGNRETNFWDIGQGPCGPDTEIFYDRGLKYDPENIGLKLLQDDLENDRYIEIWNIVFSEFNNDGNGNYEELKQKNIDTGAGLERIVSIFQDAPTNFDTDLFLPIIKKIEEMSAFSYKTENYFLKDQKQTQINKYFRIIADHIRAVSLAIQDGATPSNTQRGYIIRRLIRRAYRAGIQLGIKKQTFLKDVVATVAMVMDVYPIDVEKVSKIIEKEEASFSLTIAKGEEILQKSLSDSHEKIDEKLAFKLFETYGFPLEMTTEILKEHNVNLDLDKLKKLKDQHANSSRGQKAIGMESQIGVIQEINELKSQFVGYDQLKVESAKVLFSKIENQKAYTLFDKTPFYATSGGQEFDQGTIDGQQVIAVFKDKYQNIWHVTNKIITSQTADLVVDTQLRLKKEQNHSATHLLNAALRRVFGSQVVQLGSFNNHERLRFDFPLEKRPQPEELQEVEDIVNNYIKQNIKRNYIETSFEEAKKMGAIMLEDEEYELKNEKIRVVKFNDSIEFCGGTHIENTGLIQKFKITKFESKGSGIFRIEAITSNFDVDNHNQKMIEKLKINLESLIEKNKKYDQNYHLSVENDVKMLELAIKKAHQDAKKMRKNSSNLAINTDISFIEWQNKKTYVNLNVDSQIVKGMAIKLRELHQDALIIIGSKSGLKMVLAIASKKYNAKQVFDGLSSKYQGKGGGNSDFAMGSFDEVVVIN